MSATPEAIARELTLQLLSWGHRPQRLRPRLQDPGELIRACLEEAIALRDDGDPQRSLELIELALEHGLDDPWLLDNRARALLALGQWQDALQIWGQLRDHRDPALAQVARQMLADPELRHACRHQLDGLETTGDQQRSLELIELALEHGLDDPWLLDNRARALLALALPEPALEIWSQLRDHSDPALAQVARQRLADPELRQVVLQQVIALRDDGDPQRSLELIELALEHGLDDPWLLDNRARALLALDQPQAALAIWSQLASPLEQDGDGDLQLIQSARQMADQVEQPLRQALLAACERWSWSPEHLQPSSPPQTEPQRAAEAPIGTLLDRLLVEIVACREAGLAELSLNLATIAQEQGWRSGWLRDNEARALIHLGRKREALAIWHELSDSAEPAIAAMAQSMVQLIEDEQAREALHSELERLRGEGRWDDAVKLLVKHWRRQPRTIELLPQIEALLAEAERQTETGTDGTPCDDPFSDDPFSDTELTLQLAEARRTLTALRLLQGELQQN